MSNKKVVMRFPPETAGKMGLPISPDGIYTFSSWLELGAALAMVTQLPMFSNHRELERQMMSHHWGEVVAKQIVTTWADWQSVAAKSGLCEHHEEADITRENAVLWFTWFFFNVFYPQYDLLVQRGVGVSDFKAFAKVLMPEVVSWMALEWITDESGKFTPWETQEDGPLSSVFIKTLEQYAQALSNSSEPEKSAESILNY